MTKSSPNIESIERCLKSLLSFYDLSVDAEGILQSEVFKKNATDIDYVARILARIGFRLKHVVLDDEDVTQLHFPAIMVKDGQLSFFMSQTEAYKAFAETRGKYSGDILYIKASPTETVLDIEHMNAKHALDWFWSPIVTYWSRYSEVLISSFFMNVLVLATPIYTLNVYDRVVVHFVEETLLVLTLGVLTAIFFDFIFRTIRTYLLERIAEDIGARYDFDLMHRLMRIKTSQLHISIGELANLFRELQGIRDFYSSRLVPTLVDLPFILLFFFVIYLLAPPLVIVPITASAVIIVMNLLIHIPVKLMTQEYFSSIQSKSALLIETLAGLGTIKMFNAVGSRLLKWDVDVKRAARITRHTNFSMSLISNISLFVSQFAHVFLVFYGVYQIQEGNLTVGGLISASIISGRAIAPVMNLSGLLARLKQTNDVLKAIDNVYKIPYEDENEARKSPKGPYKGNLQIRNVSFQYAGQNKPALREVSLDIKAGDRIALIGKTAAGKTTLAKIIGGFLEPGAGNLILDNIEYEAIPGSELRRSIAYVPQDPFFFNGTIRHNILLGRENISDELLDEAIRVSGLDIVMQQTAKGLDSDVGQLGSHLSGGQKQAISLARAIVTDPQILIFDEPTTGMDSALEQRVKSELAKYLKKRTFIMITHRTTLLALVNRIVMLDNSIVIADGPTQEVLAKLQQS